MESVRDIPLPGEVVPEQPVKREPREEDDECMLEVGIEHAPIMITDTFVTSGINTSSDSLSEQTFEVEIGALMRASQSGIHAENAAANQTLEEVMNEVNAELAKSSEHILDQNITGIKNEAHDKLAKPTVQLIEQHEVSMQAEVDTSQLVDQCEVSTEYTDQCEVIAESIEYVEQTEVGEGPATLDEQSDEVSTYIEKTEVVEDPALIEHTEVSLEETTSQLQEVDSTVIGQTKVSLEYTTSQPMQGEGVDSTSQYIEQAAVIDQSDTSFEEPLPEVVEQSDISYEEQTPNIVEPSEVIAESTENCEQNEVSTESVKEQEEIVEVFEKLDKSINEPMEVCGSSIVEMEITEITDSGPGPKQIEPLVTYEPSEADSIESSHNEDKPNANLIFEEVEDNDEDSSSAQAIVEEPEEKMAVQSQEEEEMTEVLVMETVQQENAMEIGQLTENVTIEIIDTLKNHNTDMNFKEYTIETTDNVKEKDDTETVYIIQQIPENDQKTVVTDANKARTEPKVEKEIKAKPKSKLDFPVLGRPKRIATRNSNQHPDLKNPLPCHLLGRNVDNPTEDLISNGRTPPKPRLGVKVPYRFLTSQIVSKDEITDELLELVAKRNPTPDPPMGGDIFFAQKLTQRLANKIAASESARNKLATEKAESSKTETATIIEPAKPISTITEPPKSKSTTTEPTKPKSTITEPTKPKSTIIIESPKLKATKELSEPQQSSPESSTSKINDNSDLLAILEGDVDVDWTKELRSPKKTNDPHSDNTLTAEHIVSVTVTKEKIRKDLDPQLERQLALKQLQEMPGESHFGRGRRKQIFHHQDLYKPNVKSVTKSALKQKQDEPGSSRVLRTGSSLSRAVEIRKIETVVKKVPADVTITKDEPRVNEHKKLDVKKDDTTTVESKPEKEQQEEKIIDDVEPIISPRKVMKTYSRKEVVLNVPPELEYIVNETDPSALIDLEKEPEDPKPETSKETSKPEISKETPRPEILTEAPKAASTNETPKTETAAQTAKAVTAIETGKTEVAKETLKAETTKKSPEPEASKEPPNLKVEIKKEGKIPAILTKIGDLKSAIDKKMESMKITMDLKLDTSKSTTDKKAVADKTVDNLEPTISVKKVRATKAPTKVQKEESPKKVGTKKQKRIPEPELMLVSKRARIIKKKVIWDPAEVSTVRATVKKNIEDKSKNIAKKEPVAPVEIVEPVTTKEIKVPNGQTGSKKLHKKKVLPNAALRRVRKAQQMLMKRQLRSLSSKMIRTAKREGQKAMVLTKKTKTAIVEEIKRDKPKKTELDRLLMDEGAVNMLYSVRGKGLKRKAGVSRDKHHKELMNRTQMVKDVITQSSNLEDSPKALRKKESPVAAIVFTNPPRKKSRDSIRSSIQSPPPSPSFMYSHRAEASRIIRRHSSSFSSDCSSPRRLSIDVTQNAGDPKPENLQEPEKEPIRETPEIQTRLRRKGVPIFERKLEEKTYKGKKKLLPDDVKEDIKEERLTEQQGQKLTLAEKRKLNAEMSKNFSQQPLKKRTRSSKGVEEVEEEADEKDEKPKAKTPVKAPKKVEPEKKLEPEQKLEVEKPLEQEQKLEVEKPLEAEKLLEADKLLEAEKPLETQKDTRQVSVPSEYKEISLKRMDNLVQIILTPTSTKLHNTINLAMFTEMVHVLTHLSQDVTCRVVLLTSTDSTFCHGVDFSTLIQTNADKRLAVAEEMAKAVKDFLHCLASFPKPLVAGVQGSTVGLGVTMLPLFDLVFASDKATFSTPYGRLGQVPEGIAFLTLPHLLGNSLTSELLLASRKLTASEALHHGLVTRILWPDKFQEEVMSNTLAIATQSSQSMISTKRLLRKSLLAKLDEALESETKLLIEHWCSGECQQNFKKMVQEDEWW